MPDLDIIPEQQAHNKASHKSIGISLVLQREALLKPLQLVIGVVERRQTLPILSNILLSVNGRQLAITATDLEVELVAYCELEQVAKEAGAITVPGRKLMDICRALPENSTIELIEDKERIYVRSGRSRFILTTLPVRDFPKIEQPQGRLEFSISENDIRYLLQRTYFAMAQQDVRYYLNGLLLEVNRGAIRTVATDGHRLALNTVTAPIENSTFVQVIIPRKGVIELMRLLENKEAPLSVMLNDNHIGIQSASFTFTSKLVDGRFPDYEKVLPKGGNKIIIIEREVFKEALSRVSILSNEKFRGIRLQLREGLLRIVATNPEQEEAEEIITTDYHGDELDIGFNVTYLLDILNTVTKEIKLTFIDANSSVLIEEHEGDSNSLFVVMPLRL